MRFVSVLSLFCAAIFVYASASETRFLPNGWFNNYSSVPSTVGQKIDLYSNEALQSQSQQNSQNQQSARSLRPPQNLNEGLQKASQKLAKNWSKVSFDRQIEVSVISRDRADKLFEEFKADSQIPFKYPIDGCYARATEMTRIAESNGIKMAKVFAEGYLRVKTSDPRFPIVEWGWHVAPVAYVKDATGKEETMVFDPSLFDKPVTMKEWTDKMGEQGKPKTELHKLYFGNRYQYLPSNIEEPKTRWDIEHLSSSARTLSFYKTIDEAATQPQYMVSPPLKYESPYHGGTLKPGVGTGVGK